MDCKIGVIRSYFLDLVRTLATEFCTICSIFIEDVGAKQEIATNSCSG